MKKFLFGVVLLSSAIFFACGDDGAVIPSEVDIESSGSSIPYEFLSSPVEGSSSSVVSSVESSSSVIPSEVEGSSNSASQYVCDIYTLKDAVNCTCDEDRKGKLAYNHDSKVELVCILDEYLNKWGWVSKKDEESSSSKGDEAKSSGSVVPSSSSSSVIPGSDRESSSSGTTAANSSSSSVAKVSSSSEAVSSSSSYDKRNPLYGFYYHQGRYQTFVDPRNNREYYYLTFEGKDSNNVAKTIHAMVENLNIGEMVPGSGDQNDDNVIERYCYDNDTLNCYQYGGLYQWAEMMQLPSRCNTESCADLIEENHQGVCPDGWRLLTFYDLKIIVNSNGNTHGVEGIRSQYGFGGYNTTGFSLIATGYNEEYRFSSRIDSAHWFDIGENLVDSDIATYVHYQSQHSTTYGASYALKTDGYSVRCVMVE